MQLETKASLRAKEDVQIVASSSCSKYVWWPILPTLVIAFGVAALASIIALSVLDGSQENLQSSISKLEENTSSWQLIEPCRLYHQNKTTSNCQWQYWVEERAHEVFSELSPCPDPPVKQQELCWYSKLWATTVHVRWPTGIDLIAQTATYAYRKILREGAVTCTSLFMVLFGVFGFVYCCTFRKVHAAYRMHSREKAIMRRQRQMTPTKPANNKQGLYRTVGADDEDDGVPELAFELEVQKTPDGFVVSTAGPANPVAINSSSAAADEDLKTRFSPRETNDEHAPPPLTDSVVQSVEPPISTIPPVIQAIAKPQAIKPLPPPPCD